MYSVPPNISLKQKKKDVSMLLYEISSDNSDKLKLATKLGIHVTGYKKTHIFASNVHDSKTLRCVLS